jgi:hypothetical protein
MKFDLLTLTNPSNEGVAKGIASLQAELERRRSKREKLSAAEKAHVTGYLQSIIDQTDEGGAFHERLVRLAGYVRDHA